MAFKSCKSAEPAFIFLLVLVFVSHWDIFFSSRWRTAWKNRGGGSVESVCVCVCLGEKKEGGGWEESRTVTFTRYDMATLTRCPPRRSAKLLSQSASISRSQPSAAPALLGRGLVPQTNPNVGRRCHCATLKRGLEILNTHIQRPTDPPWQPP